jgi:hypothetical protein
MVRERHAHHTTVVSTGITLTGPLGDGMVHLMFHRDAAKILKEVFDSEEHAMPDGGTAMTIKGAKGPADVQYYREEVVTVLVPADKFSGFATAIQQMADSLERMSGVKGQAHG